VFVDRDAIQDSPRFYIAYMLLISHDVALVCQYANCHEHLNTPAWYTE